MLARRFQPDYLLVHPMGMDYAGETHGADSAEYRTHATRQDKWLATYLTEWLERGYNLLITGDHGMNARRPSRRHNPGRPRGAALHHPARHPRQG